jgi:biopolymer transport protein ExbD
MTRVPVRKRRTFMLTPLVDVMFLVLIFFMLSSQTGRYGLLSIVPPAGAETDAAAAVPAVADTAGAGELVVSIGAGAVRIGGQSIATDALPGALLALRSAGYERAVLLTTTAASVQDVVSVLEAFESARFARTRLVREAVVVP